MVRVRLYFSIDIIWWNNQLVMTVKAISLLPYRTRRHRIMKEELKRDFRSLIEADR